jgi:hypothetical protein
MEPVEDIHQFVLLVTQATRLRTHCCHESTIMATLLILESRGRGYDNQLEQSPEILGKPDEH